MPYFPISAVRGESTAPPTPTSGTSDLAYASLSRSPSSPATTLCAELEDHKTERQKSSAAPGLSPLDAALLQERLERQARVAARAPGSFPIVRLPEWNWQADVDHPRFDVAAGLSDPASCSQSAQQASQRAGPRLSGSDNPFPCFREPSSFSRWAIGPPLILASPFPPTPSVRWQLPPASDPRYMLRAACWEHGPPLPVPRRRAPVCRAQAAPAPGPTRTSTRTRAARQTAKPDAAAARPMGSKGGKGGELRKDGKAGPASLG